MIGAEAPIAGVITPTPEELLARDRWSRERLLVFQRERLHELLRYASASSPYYRELLGHDTGDAELAQLPILPKATLMEQFDRVVTDPRLRLAAAEAHAAGADPGALLAGRYHLFVTSGTAGRRGLFPQSPAEFGCWVAAVRRMTMRIGLPPNARLVGIGAPTPLHVTQKLFRALGGFGDGRPELAVTRPLHLLVAALNRDQPEALLTTPSAAALLAQEQHEGRLEIGPRRIVLGGEVVADDVKRRIAAAWGIEPFQVYASTEALNLASESTERVGLHVSEDLVVLEVVDEHERPVPHGLPGYKVLVTSLVNRVLPLIRYELADTVTIAPGSDPSGRPYMRIERVDGRNDDLLRLPAVGGGEALILPYRLRAPFTDLPDVLQYQVVHEPRRLAVRVVLSPKAPADTIGKIAAGLGAALEAAGAVPPPIEVEPVAELEREPGAAKVKLVKSVRSSPAT
jgi:phenylacetate-coenzyme A ligase PaaK-like adenylate-forming protein